MPRSAVQNQEIEKLVKDYPIRLKKIEGDKAVTYMRLPIKIVYMIEMLAEHYFDSRFNKQTGEVIITDTLVRLLVRGLESYGIDTSHFDRPTSWNEDLDLSSLFINGKLNPESPLLGKVEPKLTEREALKAELRAELRAELLADLRSDSGFIKKRNTPTK